MIEEGWLRIPRWQANEKSIKTLSNNGSSDQPLEKELFGTTLNLDLLNTRTLSTRQLSSVATMMNVNPLMVVVLANVLCIQLLKYHDNDDPVIHIWQLTKVYVTNGENTNDHKLQYFPKKFRGRVANDPLPKRVCHDSWPGLIPLAKNTLRELIASY